MATFLIHEDDVVLKENVGVGNEAAQRGNKLASAAAAAATAIQMQRRTFGVQLNNVQLGARAHAHKTVITNAAVCTLCLCEGTARLTTNS